MKRVVATDGAPKAIGPYSQGIEAGSFVFLSGQVALDPATGQMVAGGIAEQTERALQNLEAVLKASGLTMNHVVRTTVFLIDLGEFAAMNEVYARHFPKDHPARSTVQVVALPKGARVEIDAIALR
ncbi:MAG TPA: RidA family protein [Planctomycetota bacterium]|nr:RidA family protein [Planctomycetota bacterium]